MFEWVQRCSLLGCSPFLICCPPVWPKPGRAKAFPGATFGFAGQRRDLHLVAEGIAPVGLSRPLAGRAGPVPGKHCRGAPSPLVLEVRIGHAAELHVMGPRVTQTVEVEVPQPGLGGPAFEHLPDPVFRQDALEPEPGALRRRCPFMRPAHPEVAVDRPRRLHAHRDPADAASLPQDRDLTEFQVDVLEGKPGDLGAPEAAVEKEADDRGVTPRLERRAGAGTVECLEIGFGERVNRRDLDRRGLGAAHGRPGELAVGDGPREE